MSTAERPENSQGPDPDWYFLAQRARGTGFALPQRNVSPGARHAMHAALQNDASETLRSMRACVVTRQEHTLLTAQSDVAGWARDRAAGIIPIDMNTSEPMDLDARIKADHDIWD